jgi:hypothetical protein
MCKGLLWCDIELAAFYKEHMPDKTYTRAAGLEYACKFAFFCIVLAENSANWAMITLDYFGTIIETVLWLAAFIVLVPYVLYIHWKALRTRTSLVDSVHLLLFTSITVLIVVGFCVGVLFNFLPFMLKLYRTKAADPNYIYLPMYDGILSSIFDRVRS